MFVTAYDQYAIDAFEHGAVDYLLKPVAPERLAATVRAPAGARRAARRRGAGGAAGQAGRAAARPPARREPLTWLTASAGRETRLILVDDVAYFRADNKYTTVVTAEGEALLRTPLRELLRAAGPAHLQADPPLHHRQPEGHRRRSSATTAAAARCGCKHRPETLTVSQPFMALFKHM